MKRMVAAAKAQKQVSEHSAQAQIESLKAQWDALYSGLQTMMQQGNFPGAYQIAASAESSLWWICQDLNNTSR
ncbi:hypothetical protein [uncultured Duncaniella sp.]|uniref:hypothetical protein n=1 Tax=uncultured Duncaniella sp. TaxID=2768039 RepID=UPI00261DD63C|nr:hypothetical protein [uncultured Duncaniella sp.]